jgi:HAD superfamily hydrolase (TIGR01549 family)
MARSWSDVRAKLGIAVPFEAYFRHIGRPFADIMTALGLAEHAAEIEAVYRVASMEHIDAARFYPGTADAVARLHAAKTKLGVVTSKDELRTSAILAMLPIVFDVVMTPNDRSRGKPAPDHLLAAMAHAGVDPADTIYVGDMDADFEAARRAQIDYAHAAWGYGETPRGCNAVLREIADLSTIVGIELAAKRAAR